MPESSDSSNTIASSIMVSYDLTWAGRGLGAGGAKLGAGGRLGRGQAGRGAARGRQSGAEGGARRRQGVGRRRQGVGRRRQGAQMCGEAAPGGWQGRCQAAPGAGGARGRKKDGRWLWRPEPPVGRAVGRS